MQIGSKHTQETKHLISDRLVGRVQSVEERLMRSHIRIGTKHSEETKARIADALRDRNKPFAKGYDNPAKRADVRRKISLKLKGRIFTEEWKNKLRKPKNMTKEENELLTSKRLKSCCARPNKFEVRALAHLNIIYSNKFKYTGDGSFIVNRRSADAYSKELNTVALFNGIYWHLGKYGFKNTEHAKGAVELIESIPFLEAGYKVIFIWEDEI